MSESMIPMVLVGDPRSTLSLASEMGQLASSPLPVAEAGDAFLDELRRIAAKELVVVKTEVNLEKVLDRLRASAPAHLQYNILVGHTIAEVERGLILATLDRCRGNRTTAAGILGISVRTMRNKLRHFMDEGIPVMPAASV